MVVFHNCISAQSLSSNVTMGDIYAIFSDSLSKDIESARFKFSLKEDKVNYNSLILLKEKDSMGYKKFIFLFSLFHAYHTRRAFNQGYIIYPSRYFLTPEAGKSEKLIIEDLAKIIKYDDFLYNDSVYDYIKETKLYERDKDIQEAVHLFEWARDLVDER